MSYILSSWNDIIFLLVIGIVFSLVSGGVLIYGDPISDSNGYGVVGPETGEIEESAVIVNYSELSESDKEAFRQSKAYVEQTTVLPPRSTLSTGLSGVDYIQLDGTYYLVSGETDTSLGLIGLFAPMFLFMGAFSLYVAVLGLSERGLSKIFRQNIDTIEEYKSLFSWGSFIISLGIVACILLSLLSMYSGLSLAVSAEVQGTSSSVSDSEITEYNELNTEQQQVFRSLATGETIPSVDAGIIEEYKGEYIRSDGEIYYIEETQNKWLLITIGVFSSIIALFVSSSVKTTVDAAMKNATRSSG